MTSSAGSGFSDLRPRGGTQQLGSIRWDQVTRKKILER
jgi:hypothetical protein